MVAGWMDGGTARIYDDEDAGIARMINMECITGGLAGQWPLPRLIVRDYAPRASYG